MERRARGTLTNRRKMRTRELVPFFLFFFFIMYRVFERNGIGIFKGKDFKVFCLFFVVIIEVRQFHLMKRDKDGTIRK